MYKAIMFIGYESDTVSDLESSDLSREDLQLSHNTKGHGKSLKQNRMATGYVKGK